VLIEAGEGFDQSLDAEVDWHVAGLDQAVGVAEEKAARGEGKLSFLITADAQAEWRARRCIELAHRPGRVAHEQRGVPSVGDAETTAGRGVEDRVDGGGEFRWHGGCRRSGWQVDEVADVAVQHPEHVGGAEVGKGGCSHPGACLTH
jgi:hypothetical protein